MLYKRGKILKIPRIRVFLFSRNRYYSERSQVIELLVYRVVESFGNAIFGSTVDFFFFSHCDSIKLRTRPSQFFVILFKMERKKFGQRFELNTAAKNIPTPLPRCIYAILFFPCLELFRAVKLASERNKVKNL